MNPNTGHLIDTSGYSKEQLEWLIEQNYVPVSDELARAARLKLAGQREAMVSLTSGGKLSKFAAEMRGKKGGKIKRSYKDYCR